MPRRALLVVALASLLSACAPAGPGPSETPSASAPLSDGAPSNSGPTQSAPSAKPADSGPPPAASSAGPTSPATYALVVSFFSPGNGTDHAAFDTLTAIVAKLPKKVAQVSSPWGKEGEHDECFTLAELDAKEKAAFVAQVKKDVGKSNRVTIKEDAACQSR